MEFTQTRTVKIVAVMLLLAAILQPIYTLLFQYVPDFTERKILWGLEGLLFTLLAAFAGSALVMAKRYTLGFAAIAFSAVLNVVQVGVGLTQFGPFGAAAGANPEIFREAAGGIFAFSFFAYNAAKILLGLAAFELGMGKLKDGGKALGGLTALVGAVALVLNALAMMFGRQGLPDPLPMAAGATGVVATLLLAICLFSLREENA